LKILIDRKDLSDLNLTFPFPSVDWTPEEGYPKDAEHDALPWRPVGAGKHLGLTLVLDNEIDEYFCSSTASVGFKAVEKLSLNIAINELL
jgi:acid-sensing ion channel, other